MDLEALYKRILGHVAPSELHRSCNEVLHHEISQLQQSLQQITAAYDKLEEIRDAVKQLEQNAPPTGRSDSLLETMEVVVELHQELEQGVRKMATGIDLQANAEVELTRTQNGENNHQTQNGKQKKRRKVETESEDSSSEESEEETKKSEKKEKKKEDSTNSELKLAHECFDLMKSVGVEKKHIMKETKTLWTDAVLCLQRLIERQSRWSPSQTIKPAAEVAARALEATIAIFGKLKMTETHAQEVKKLTSALTRACSKNDILRSAYYRGRAQLESISMTIGDVMPATKKEVKPPSPKNAGSMGARSKEMKERLTSHQKDLTQWQDGIFSVDQLDKVMKVANEVMAYQAKDWNPRADPVVRECLEKVVSCIKLIKKESLRDKRSKTAGKWMKALER